jgi:hypothetical protein
MGKKSRKKTVFNNQELCHAWAAYNRDPKSLDAPPSHGRNTQGSLYYEGDEIYSYGYHFLAAKFHTTANGPVVLINNDNYSPTTAKHLRDLHRAVRDLPTLSVKDPSDPRASLDDNLISLMELLFDLLKQNRPEYMWDVIKESFIPRHNDMCAAFRFSDLVIEIPEDLNEVITAHVESRRAVNEERERIKKEKREAEMAELKLLDAKDFDDWLCGVSNRVPFSYHSGEAFIRIKGSEVETSQGARVPLNKAKVMARYLACGDDQKIIGQTIGYYKIDKVTRPQDGEAGSGYLEIGCHTMSIDHVLEVLKPNLANKKESN